MYDKINSKTALPIELVLLRDVIKRVIMRVIRPVKQFAHLQDIPVGICSLHKHAETVCKGKGRAFK